MIEIDSSPFSMTVVTDTHLALVTIVNDLMETGRFLYTTLDHIC